MDFVRLLLVAVLLTFPAAALGDSIDYQGVGLLTNHTAFERGMIAAGHIWEAGDRLTQIIDLTTGHIVRGNLGIVDVTTGRLLPCAAGFCFAGGTLDIDSIHGGSIFDGNFSRGSIDVENGFVVLNAFFTNGAAAVIRDHRNSFSTQALVRGVGAQVPEPATFALMGSGLVSLAFLWRKRKTTF